jgi:hypothetical protein
MTWNLSLFRAPEEVRSVRHLPDGFVAEPIGFKPEVLARIKAARPDVDLTDPSWLELRGPTWLIEFPISERDSVTAVGLRLHGNSDDLLPVVHRVARALGCRVLDLSSGDFLEVSTGHGAPRTRRQGVVGQSPGSTN